MPSSLGRTLPFSFRYSQTRGVPVRESFRHETSGSRVDWRKRSCLPRRRRENLRQRRDSDDSGR